MAWKNFKYRMSESQQQSLYSERMVILMKYAIFLVNDADAAASIPTPSSRPFTSGASGREDAASIYWKKGD